MTAELTISLIGMPGSGKSTIGTALAARLDLELVDADGLIEATDLRGHPVGDRESRSVVLGAVDAEA